MPVIDDRIFTKPKEEQMDAYKREDILDLMNQEGDAMISIFMPTHTVGQATLENPIQLKNMIAEVEGLLRQKGKGSGEIRDLVTPLAELIDNGSFWQHQAEGLAIFRSSNTFQTMRLPINVEECTIVNNRFYTRPLLPLLHNNGSFYLLSLSIDKVRLYSCDRHDFQEMDLGEVPTSMEDALGDEQLTDTLNFHTNTQSAQGGERAGIFFGKGSSNDSHKKKDVLRFFTILENGINRLINQSTQPMVLAGVEYLLPIYREKNRYGYVLEQGITGNPEDRRVEDMHQEAWALVEPQMDQARMDAIDGYHILCNDHQSSNDIREILPAAYFGQVDILFVSTESKLWGKFDPDTQAVDIHERRQPDDEDLIDLAAKFAMTNGGLIYTYDMAEMPDGALIAATMRYPLKGLSYADDEESKNQQKNHLK
jgi:hypothetical protein